VGVCGCRGGLGAGQARATSTVCFLAGNFRDSGLGSLRGKGKYVYQGATATANINSNVLLRKNIGTRTGMSLSCLFIDPQEICMRTVGSVAFLQFEASWPVGIEFFKVKGG